MERKQNRTKINFEMLKYALFLVGFVVSLAVLFLVQPENSSELTGTTNVKINFSNDVNLDDVVDRTGDLGSYERIEKVNSTQVVVDFTELDKSDEDLNNKYSEVEGFNSLESTKTNLVSKYSFRVSLFSVTFVVLFVILQYFFLSSVEKSRDRVGLIIALIVQNAFAFLVFLSILFSLSHLTPLTNELLTIFAALMVARFMVDIVLLFKLNLAAEVNLQSDFPNFVEEFVLKYDRNFVIVTLFSTIVFLPLVLVSTEPIASGILLVSFISLNVLIETFVFSDLVKLFYFLIENIPVVRNLKWSRK